MSPLIWATLILILGLALLVLEMFIPSAGILSVLAATAVIISIGMVFVYEPISVATAFLAMVSVVVPVLGFFLIKWWPRTPIGRRILNLPSADDETTTQSAGENRWAGLVGKRGRAKSKMLPSGAIEVEGRVFDAVSEGPPINPGDWVQVIQARGNLIVVRPSAQGLAPSTTAQSSPAQPLETAIPDPFDDSLP